MGIYSEFDVERRDSVLNEGLLSAYVEVAGSSPAPAQPDTGFKLLPDDGEPTPFEKAETNASQTTDIPVTETSENAPASTETGKGSEDTGEEKAVQDEDAARKAHEESEARRKAEFDARQAEKKAAMQAQLDKIAAMSTEELLAASMQRVSADTERLTRRNMKECVSEYIQTRCLEDPDFARMVMHPGKSMVRCFQYINRKARAYIEQDMKDNDIDPHRTNGVYGGDVPDGLCYQWGEDYFRDPDAEEDHRDDEKFIPKPWHGGRNSSKSKSRPKESKKKTEKKSAPADSTGQISLMEMAS